VPDVQARDVQARNIQASGLKIYLLAWMTLDIQACKCNIASLDLLRWQFFRIEDTEMA
jgi:hypothetical protein